VENRARLARELAATVRARSIYLGPGLVRLPGAAPEPAVAETGVDDFEAARGEALACTACALCETRTNVVFGEGSRDSDLVFVGEAPGHDEDQSGRPFVGRAGQLLTKMIGAMGYQRDEVYIANVLKCRPPSNRDPAADEVEKCRPYLLRQLEAIDPKVICALGRHALRALTGYEGPIGRVRGRPMRFGERIVVPTFHPAYLLRNPAAKADAWADLQAILKLLGRPLPERKKRQG
jgi:DNA polymerase